MLSRLLAVLSPRLFGYVLLYLGRCAVATVHVAVEAPSFLSLQSCTRTLDRLYASTRSVYAKWYWVNHGRLTSEQSCTRTLERQRTIMHSNTRQALNASTRSVYAKWVLGKSRQAHQRTAGSPANAKLTFRYPSSLINHSTLLLERSSAKLLVFYAGSPANNHAPPANNHALEHSTGSEQSCTRTLDRL